MSYVHTGVFGYTWVVVLHILAKLSFKTTLLLANISSVAWLAVYFLMLESPEQKQSAARALMKAGSDKSEQRISIDRSHQADLPGHVAPEDQDHPLLQRKSELPANGAGRPCYCIGPQMLVWGMRLAVGDTLCLFNIPSKCAGKGCQRDEEAISL